MWMLVRVILAIYAYGLARDDGDKHLVAILEAVNYIGDKCPWMPISETEVKRIVAEWRPKGAAICLFVSRPDAEHSTLRALRRGGIVNARIVYTVSVGPRPIYPRANAAA